MKANITQVPSFRALDYNEKNKSMFVSNLTIILNDFHNEFHCDKDYNSYSYDIWALAFLDSCNLASQKIDSLKVESL